MLNKLQNMKAHEFIRWAYWAVICGLLIAGLANSRDD